MSGVDRAVRDQRVIVSQVVSGGNVIAGFIPEEGQAQQGQMKNENGNKDEGKNLQRGDESRAIGGCCHLSVSFSFELPVCRGTRVAVERSQWICAGAWDMLGSILISPNVFSY